MNESIDPECALAFAYAGARAKGALTLLWNVDAMLGRFATTAREPMLAAIRLAWWRDALAALGDATPPAEPALREIAAVLLPAGVTGAELAALAEAWIDALAADDEPARLGRAAFRGERLFVLAASILGGAMTPGMRAAGEGWGLVDHARRSGGGREREAALAAAGARLALAPRRWPGRLRPIGMLAALARIDARRPAAAMARQGSPLRLLRMARHRLTGS